MRFSLQLSKVGQLVLFFSILFVFLYSEWDAFHTFFEGLELQTLTLRQKFYCERVFMPKSDQYHPNISVVTIDNKSLRSRSLNILFGRSPWRRDIYGYLVRYFKRSHSQKVIFDWSFSNSADLLHPEADQFLIESTLGTDKFISDLMFDTYADPILSWSAIGKDNQQALTKNSILIEGMEKFPSLQQRVPSLILPLSSLLQKGDMRFYSSMGSLLDEIGVARKWQPFIGYGGQWYPSLSLGAVMNQERRVSIDSNGILSWKGGQVHIGTQGPPIVKWYGDQRLKKIYPQYSFVDIILSELTLECEENPHLQLCHQVKFPKKPLVQPEVFSNQYVLVGPATENASGDENTTIMGNRKYPGIFILANQLDNLLHNDFVVAAAPWINWLCILLGIGFALRAVLFYESVLVAFCLMMALIFGYIVLSIQAYTTWNTWLNLVYPITGMLVTYVGGYVFRYQTTEKRKQQLRFAFGKYVSPAVMASIEKNPNEIRLEGQRRTLTILFCDIRDFTTFSEQHDAETVRSVLSDYFSLMNEIIIHQYGGSVNKLIGDSIMAFWGFPFDSENQALLAVSAALQMKKAMEKWCEDPKNPPFRIGIGINTGEAIIGNVGSADFMDFTVIGDTVNIAARLETLNKELGTTIIISAATYEKVRDYLSEYQSLGHASLKGKETTVEIFEPISLSP